MIFPTRSPKAGTARQQSVHSTHVYRLHSTLFSYTTLHAPINADYGSSLTYPRVRTREMCIQFEQTMLPAHLSFHIYINRLEEDAQEGCNHRPPPIPSRPTTNLQHSTTKSISLGSRSLGRISIKSIPAHHYIPAPNIRCPPSLSGKQNQAPPDKRRPTPLRPGSGCVFIYMSAFLALLNQSTYSSSEDHTTLQNHALPS